MSIEDNYEKFCKDRFKEVQLELLDDVTANLDRDESPWLGDVDLRVHGITKDLMANLIELELREI